MSKSRSTYVIDLKEMHTPIGERYWLLIYGGHKILADLDYDDIKYLNGVFKKILKKPRKRRN